MRVSRTMLLILIGLSPVISACPEEGSTCRDYVSPPSFDAQSPRTTLSNDVMPIFGLSCRFPSCHGSASTPNGLYLGAMSSKEVRMAIVGVRSVRLPQMSYVEPGAPEASFLMRKLDNSQCALNGRCTNTDCGQSMPYNSDVLGLAERDTVRRWIAQGAKDD